MDAVSRYYNIGISEYYFTNATEGRIATVYEYAKKTQAAGFGFQQMNVPTWLILLSDEPFGNIKEKWNN